MTIIIDAIIPLFSLILLGYLAGRSQAFNEAGAKGLSTFVFNFAIPALLVRSISNATLPNEIPWIFLFCYYFATLAVLFTCRYFCRRFFQLPAETATIMAMGGAYSNIVLIGIPLIISSLGDQALIPLFLIVSTHAAIMFFCTTVLLESGDAPINQTLLQTIRELGRNPIFISVFIGIGLNLLSWPIPKPIDTVLAPLANAALPVAIFSLGVSLSVYQVKDALSKAMIMVIFKNLIHPVLVFGLCLGFSLDPIWSATAVLLAGCPIGINVYVFAQKYQQGIIESASAMVISTAVSFFSLSYLVVALVN